VTLDDRLAQLVRDAVAPMLAQQLELLEERLAERLSGLVERPEASTAAAPPLLTQGDVAAQLRVAPRTLQRMVKAGEFPRPVPISPGRARWRQVDVDTWLDRQGGR